MTCRRHLHSHCPSDRIGLSGWRTEAAPARRALPCGRSQAYIQKGGRGGGSCKVGRRIFRSLRCISTARTPIRGRRRPDLPICGRPVDPASTASTADDRWMLAELSVYLSVVLAGWTMCSKVRIRNPLRSASEMEAWSWAMVLCWTVPMPCRAASTRTARSAAVA